MTSLTASSVMHLFYDCRSSGLDLVLATTVPMSFEEQVDAEDMSSGELVRLCEMLIKDLELTEDDARAGLVEIRDSSRKQVWTRSQFNGVQGSFNLRHFKKSVLLVSSITRIDQAYIVLHMQWQTTGLFEMTDALAALVLERCFRENGSCADRDSKARSLMAGTTATCLDAIVEDGCPDMRRLNKKVELDDFQRLLYNCSLVDEQSGIAYGDIALIFRRALRDLEKGLQARAEKRKLKMASADTNEKKFFRGRAEVEILMEELSRTPVMHGLCANPLHMVVGLVAKS